MTKFNKKEKVKNLAGGMAYSQEKEMSLLALLLTSFVDDKFYESSKQNQERLLALLETCDKEFCAKAILYARREFGMRSITHVAASMLARRISGETWAKNFYDKIVYRLDDMTEILALHLSNKQKLANAMKRGFASAFERFDAYQIAKYRGEGNKVKLVDAVNLVHPKKSPKNGDAIELLVKGELKSFDTWENMLSAAGNDIEAKKKVWRALLSEKKLGYMALLRNVRNILSLGDAELYQMCLDALLDKDAIHKSHVLPFRFSTAYEQISRVDSKAMSSISKACEIACDNVPRLDGRTLIALDTSGSMSGKPSRIASLFAAVLLKTNDCDLMTFDDYAKYKNVNPDDSLLTIQSQLHFCGGGTNFSSVFERAVVKYDRIIILSDMQSWRGYYSPKGAYLEYKQKFGIESCKVYSIDLAGYGTLMLPEKDVYCLAGFSEKIFDLMALMEQGMDALHQKISEISLD